MQLPTFFTYMGYDTFGRIQLLTYANRSNSRKNKTDEQPF